MKFISIPPQSVRRHRLLPLIIFFLLMCCSRQLFAADPATVTQLAEQNVNTGTAVQQNHEVWIQEEDQLFGEIESLEHKLEHVQWQRHKLAIYNQDITGKIADLEKKAAAMEAVNQELLPILEKNLGHLKQELAQDIPCNMSERRKSLLHAQTVLNDYDMSLLDKTRAILDAIAREVDLGHHVNVWEDEIEADGSNRSVKILQVGRIGLYAMTMDSKKAFSWSQSDSRWLPADRETENIHKAIEMAEGIRLVGLNNLPVNAPVERKVLEGQKL